MRRISLVLAVIVLAIGVSVAPRLLTSRPATSPDLVNFESPHVHPIAMTPSRDRLLVVNTPDARLSVFDITGPAPVRIGEIPVGLDPISVSALDDSTAWVVNLLSDDVCVVNLNTLHVRATVRVGDEPGDVVFAGSPLRAYVSVGGEDVVKVYDPLTLTRTTTIPVNGRVPRALARNAAGSKVYVGQFVAGNQTTVLSASEVPADSMPEDLDFPRDPGLPATPPRVGLMVLWQGFGSNGPGWYDMYGNFWSSKAKYTLRDANVSEIQTATNTVSREFGKAASTTIASTVMGLAVNPASGQIAATGTHARSQFRFEPRLVGYLVETQMGFINDASGTVTIRVLDPHVNYDVVPGTQAEVDSAIGIPTGVTFSGGGGRAYVTSFATNKLAVLNPVGGAASTIKARVTTVAGPTGVLEDSLRGRVYVVGRYHNQLQTLSTADFSQVALASIGFDPTPDEIVNGRKFFYGGFTSAHGDQACASCHVFGDTDGIAWNLGEPSGAFIPGTPPLHGFDPMKGPLMTQSLRQIANTGVLHWRGDRADFAAFNPAFVSLMGRSTSLPDSEMTALTDFVMSLTYPPNPNQHLDRTFPDAPAGQPSAERGRQFFFNTPVDTGGLTCASCHTAAGFAPGTNGTMIPYERLGEFQDFKVPQLRNLYTKTGFRDSAGAVNKRGFGYTHDGSVDRLIAVHDSAGFDFGSPQAVADANRRDLAAYLLAFDTGIAPAVGVQVTFNGTSNPTGEARLDSLIQQASAGNCDLFAKGRIGGQPRGWLYGGWWRPDKSTEAVLTKYQLLALAGLGSELTFTAVPTGAGTRMGIDRDRDGALDGDELDAATDPGDPASFPAPTADVAPGGAGGAFGLRSVRPNPFRSNAEIEFSLGRAGAVDVVVYDILGRQVRSLARAQRMDPGPHVVRWDGRGTDGNRIGAGVYFVRVRTEAGSYTRPLVHLE